MFKHSIKVPRLYKTAVKVAKDVKEGLGSLKQLVYEYKSKHPNIKAIYALVATLFQRNDEIENLLKRSQLLEKEPRLDPWLTKILIVELLWGKKSLPGGSKPEKTVLAYEQIFKAHLSDAPVDSKENALDSKDQLKPRYVRVNTLYMSLNEAIDGFRDEGWVFSKFLDKSDYNGFIDKITSLADGEFFVDIHIPNLLIFPPKTQFYNHPAYKNGGIVLQDKASCLPVHILDPPPGSVVLDMCSAPGMKTTQVAAAINNEGKVYAVERDPRRFETLNKIVEVSGATCITTINKDVITCTEKDFPGVQYILVDPSCSGSGITDRLGFEQSKSNQRIEKLAGFQIKILRSALTKYPDAKRVVYSTCSVFPEENEDVVRQVLETNSSFKLVPATKFVNNTWRNFGSPEYGDIGSYCLYAKPNEDFTNGFFVAVFERLEEGEVNQFFNTKIYNFKKHVQSQENRKRKQQQLNNFNNSTKDKQFSKRIENDNEENKEEIVHWKGLEYGETNNYFEPADKLIKVEKEELGNNQETRKPVEPVNIKKKKRKDKKLTENNVSYINFQTEVYIKTEEEEEDMLKNVGVKEESSKRKKKKKDKYFSKNDSTQNNVSYINLQTEVYIKTEEEEDMLKNVGVKEESSKRKKKKKEKYFSKNDSTLGTDLEIPHAKLVEPKDEVENTSIKEEPIESVKRKKKDKNLIENGNDTSNNLETAHCTKKKRKTKTAPESNSDSNDFLLETAPVSKKKRGFKLVDENDSFQMQQEDLKVRSKEIKNEENNEEYIKIKKKRKHNKE